MIANVYYKSSIICWIREQITQGNSIPVVNHGEFSYIKISTYTSQGYSEDESIDLILDSFKFIHAVCHGYGTDDAPNGFNNLSDIEYDCIDDFVEIEFGKYIAIWDYEKLTSHELRDRIAYYEGIPEYALGETTEGWNGYPQHIQGTIDMAKAGCTYGDALNIALRYGLELVNGRKRDGWHFFEKRGDAYDEYDCEEEHDGDDDMFEKSEACLKEAFESILENTEDTERRKRIRRKEKELMNANIDFNTHAVYYRNPYIEDAEIVPLHSMSIHNDVWYSTILLNCDV